SGTNTVWAVFGFVEVVHVHVPGSGEGTVRSLPAGIDCGDTCAAAFTGDTPVVLHAVAKRGSVFRGWSGAGCRGTRDCTVHQPYGTVAVWAQFDKKDDAAGGNGGGGSPSSGGSAKSNPAGPF